MILTHSLIHTHTFIKIPPVPPLIIIADKSTLLSISIYYIYLYLIPIMEYNHTRFARIDVVATTTLRFADPNNF